MRQRTPSEIKAYGDGYAEAYKEFCHLLERHDKDKAIRKMKIFVDAVALTVETATDTADTPQTDCETCRHYKLACELFSEVCKYEPTTQNSNLTFEKRTMLDCYNCKWYKSDDACVECRYEPKADTPQTDRMTEEEIDTMLAKDLVGQTDCSWMRYEE